MDYYDRYNIKYKIKELKLEPYNYISEGFCSFEHKGKTYFYKHWGHRNWEIDEDEDEEGAWDDETVIYLEKDNVLWEHEGYVQYDEAIDEFVDSLQ